MLRATPPLAVPSRPAASTADLKDAARRAVVLLAAACIGIGSAIFHPESSRIARLASGGQHGFAQSVFQVGGNTGTAIGPLLAAAVIVPFGQHSAAWFGLVVLPGILGSNLKAAGQRIWLGPRFINGLPRLA